MLPPLTTATSIPPPPRSPGRQACLLIRAPASDGEVLCFSEKSSNLCAVCSGDCRSSTFCEEATSFGLAGKQKWSEARARRPFPFGICVEAPCAAHR